MGQRRTTLPALAILALALAGCGFGAGSGTGGASVTVTRNFGAQRVAAVSKAKLPGSETVMRMLERFFHVQTRYGGGFVESIDGHSGNSSRVDWFYYVNGIEAPKGAAGTAVHGGDRIWWDLHDWTATNSVAAVVGSFPEPFVHGIGGRRLPTALECATDAGAACKKVTSELNAFGVPVSSQLLGTGSGTDSLAVVVGTWNDLRRSLAAALIEKGPSASGVYARFGAGAAPSLELLDAQGNVARVLGPGSGLIAATAQGSAQPTWLVTGTDAAGVSAAAAALTPARLHDAFALAVQGGSDLPLPIVSRG